MIAAWQLAFSQRSECFDPESLTQGNAQNSARHDPGNASNHYPFAERQSLLRHRYASTEFGESLPIRF
jgi:hypothetical protein